MKILVFGNAKTGTTGVFNSIKEALLAHSPQDYFFLSEPSSEALRSVNKYAPNSPLLVKAMINKNMYDIDHGQFDKHILISRDPRDTIVSKLLYYPLQPFAIRRANPKRTEDFLDLIEAKEADPASQNLRDLFEFAVTHLDRDREWSWKKYMSRHTAAIYHSRHHDYFDLKYEAFVDNSLHELSDYLDVPVRHYLVHPDTRTGHVIRSATHGEWRNWFTPDDISFFQPLFQDYMTAFSYDTDWTLAANPVIDRSAASGHIREKKIGAPVEVVGR